jgi:hypothetical protein
MEFDHSEQQSPENFPKDPWLEPVASYNQYSASKKGFNTLASTNSNTDSLSGTMSLEKKIQILMREKKLLARELILANEKNENLLAAEGEMESIRKENSQFKAEIQKINLELAIARKENAKIEKGLSMRSSQVWIFGNEIFLGSIEQ